MSVFVGTEESILLASLGIHYFYIVRFARGGSSLAICEWVEEMRRWMTMSVNWKEGAMLGKLVSNQLLKGETRRVGSNWISLVVIFHFPTNFHYYFPSITSNLIKNSSQTQILNQKTWSKKITEMSYFVRFAAPLNQHSFNLWKLPFKSEKLRPPLPMLETLCDVPCRNIWIKKGGVLQINRVPLISWFLFLWQIILFVGTPHIVCCMATFWNCKLNSWKQLTILHYRF